MTHYAPTCKLTEEYLSEKPGIMPNTHNALNEHVVKVTSGTSLGGSAAASCAILTLFNNCTLHPWAPGESNNNCTLHPYGRLVNQITIARCIHGRLVNQLHAASMGAG